MEITTVSYHIYADKVDHEQLIWNWPQILLDLLTGRNPLILEILNYSYFLTITLAKSLLDDRGERFLRMKKMTSPYIPFIV